MSTTKRPLDEVKDTTRDQINDANGVSQPRVASNVFVHGMSSVPYIVFFFDRQLAYSIPSPSLSYVALSALQNVYPHHCLNR